jgi:hydrogenase maturation protease
VIKVIGIGNRDRGDDAAGLVVTDRLLNAVPDGVSVLQVSGDPIAALENIGSADGVVIVDAMAAAGSPGTVRRFLGTDGSELESYRGRSSHGLGVGDVIRLAAALGSLPERTVVYGIEGQDFQPGHGLTRPVTEAIPSVVARILEEVR